jgi:hypothetical protein
MDRTSKERRNGYNPNSMVEKKQKAMASTNGSRKFAYHSDLYLQTLNEEERKRRNENIERIKSWKPLTKSDLLEVIEDLKLRIKTGAQISYPEHFLEKEKACMESLWHKHLKNLLDLAIIQVSTLKD